MIKFDRTRSHILYKQSVSLQVCIVKYRKIIYYIEWIKYIEKILDQTGETAALLCRYKGSTKEKMGEKGYGSGDTGIFRGLPLQEYFQGSGKIIYQPVILKHPDPHFGAASGIFSFYKRKRKPQCNAYG